MPRIHQRETAVGFSPSEMVDEFSSGFSESAVIRIPVVHRDLSRKETLAPSDPRECGEDDYFSDRFLRPIALANSFSRRSASSSSRVGC